jgi:hypothetical protein
VRRPSTDRPTGTVAAVAVLLVALYFSATFALLADRDVVVAAALALAAGTLVALGRASRQLTAIAIAGALIAAPPFAVDGLALVGILDPAGDPSRDRGPELLLGIPLLAAPLALLAAGAALGRRDGK